MPSKNDLTQIKATEKKILQKEKNLVPKGSTPGRKKKSPEEKESELVPIKLRPAEYEALANKAGMVKVATYLKHLIRTETDWLEDK